MGQLERRSVSHHSAARRRRVRSSVRPRIAVGIRRARAGDARAIAAIYNEAVLRTTATFDTEPRSPAAQRQWLEHHGPQHPVFVAVRDGSVVGWASLSPWSDRRAYRRTAEVSVYVAEAFRGRGIGGRLLRRLVSASDSLGFRCLLARIAAGNPASERMHLTQRFRPVGTMHSVGFKFGRWIDVQLLERLGSRLRPPVGDVG